MERGCKFIELLARMNGGKLPATQTANFMPNVSHQDYSMLSYNISLYRLFEETPSGATAVSSAKVGSSKTTNKAGAASSALMVMANNALTASFGLGAVVSFGLSLL